MDPGPLCHEQRVEGQTRRDLQLRTPELDLSHQLP